MPKALTLMDGMKIGADPELFIYDTENDEYICPDGLIPGTKEEPFKVDGGAVQQDGFAAEFNIDPCTNYSDFSDRMRGVQDQLQKMLPKNYVLRPDASAQFSPEQWDRASDQTKVLGCSPDYNAWTLNVNPPAKAKDMLRCAGGHLHFGWTEDADMTDKEYYKAVIDLVRQLDWMLGGWSLNYDKDKLRRKMYGKAGSMRFKPYGVEYRTLSNFWLDTDKDRNMLLNTWNRCCRAIELMADQHYPTEFASYNLSLIRGINNSDSNEFVFSSGAFSTPIKQLPLAAS